MSVVFTSNYFLVEDDVYIDSVVLLVIDFVNLNIKPVQSFEGVYRSWMYIRVFIAMIAHTYI
jgi:hypothetical protein